MKQRILFCLLLAFSAVSHGQPACFLPIDFVLLFFVEVTDDCNPPYKSPPSWVTAHTKDTHPAVPRGFQLDEDDADFLVLAQAVPTPPAKTTPAAQGIGAGDAVPDFSGRYLYVANDGSNEVSAWRVDPGSGRLSAIPGAPFKAGKSPSALAVHPSNQFLYTADFDSASVSAFRIDPANGALTAISTFPVAAIPGSVAIHPSGRFLYVTSAVQPGTSVVQAYAIDTSTGALSVLGAPIAPVGFPASVVVDRFGKFVYFISNGIEAYAVGASGTLTAVPGSPFAATSARQLALAPDGKFMYVFSRSARTVSVFSIDRNTGALAAAGSPYAVGSNPRSIRVTPSGRFLLVADPGSLVDNGTDQIRVYAIDKASGALAPIAGSPFATPPGPNTPDVIAVNAVSPKSFASVGAAYANTNFTVHGGQPPYAWSIGSAALPPGLALDAQTGAISGTPTQAGTFNFTVRVADAQGLAAARAYFITVNEAVPVVEFYNSALDHYFITWVPDEIAKLDAGTVIKGWTRTGQSFKTYTTAQAGTSPVCRYYIPPALGDSHFFGRGTVECNSTGQKNPSFVLEDPAFMQMFLPAAGVCPANTTQVYRVFSNRPDANHRYMTDKAIRTQMTAKGWLAEGDGPDLVVMCAPQ